MTGGRADRNRGCTVLRLDQLEDPPLGISRTRRQHVRAGRAHAHALIAAPVDRDRHRPCCQPDRICPASDRVIREVPSGEHDEVRTVDGQCVADPRHPSGGQAQDLDAGADAEQLERADIRGIAVEFVARRVTDHDRDGPHRRRCQSLRASQPVVAPVRCERPRGRLGAVAADDLVERRQQDLLDRPLDRPQRERRLDRDVGPLALVGDERADERIAVCREPFARAGHRRGDRQTLLQRVAQRGDFAVREQAVLARRTLWLGEPETPLPGSQRVRAHVKERCRLARF